MALENYYPLRTRYFWQNFDGLRARGSSCRVPVRRPGTSCRVLGEPGTWKRLTRWSSRWGESSCCWSGPAATISSNTCIQLFFLFFTDFQTFTEPGRVCVTQSERKCVNSQLFCWMHLDKPGRPGALSPPYTNISSICPSQKNYLSFFLTCEDWGNN